MKTKTTKLILLVLAAAMLIFFAACGAQEQKPDPAEPDNTPTATDVSGTNVSGTDAEADAAAAVVKAYADAFNDRDAAKLVELTCSAPIENALAGGEKTKEALAAIYSEKINATVQSAGEDCRFELELIASRVADAKELEAFATGLCSMGGSAELVQALRVYTVKQTLDGSSLSEPMISETNILVYKYDGKWFVFGE